MLRACLPLPKPLCIPPQIQIPRNNPDDDDDGDTVVVDIVVVVVYPQFEQLDFADAVTLGEKQRKLVAGDVRCAYFFVFFYELLAHDVRGDFNQALHH